MPAIRSGTLTLPPDEHPPSGCAAIRLELGSRPLLMGIVNAAPDSFSDGGDYPTLDARIGARRGLLAAGADLLDVGGESARRTPRRCARRRRSSASCR